MAYCGVPKCNSDGKRKLPGISFHEIPSDSEARAPWLKAIARKDWTPNTTSLYSVVCSRHFLPTDYKEGCKTRKLKRGATPSVFDDYPEYMQPKPKKSRGDAAVRKRAVAVDIAATRPLKKRTSTSLFVGADEDSVRRDGPSPSFSYPGTTELECFGLPEQAEVHATTEPILKHQATQVRSSISVLERRKLRRKERDLKGQIQRLRQTVDKYKEEVKQLKEDCNLTAFVKVLEAAQEKHVGACILVDQVTNFSKVRPTYSEVTVRNCIVLRNLSAKAYEFIRSKNLLKLPSRATLQRFLGVTTGEVGFTSLVKERLKAELENLTTQPQQAKVCSLVVDEMRIRQRLQYNKQTDTFVGEVDLGQDFGTPTKGEPVLANSLLCFVLTGLSVRIRIPVGYFFTKNCTGQQLFTLMNYVLKEVETAGFLVARIVTDNHKINVLALELLCNGKLEHSIKHPEDPARRLFVAFDQCHLIKNIRSLFLARDIG
ncbi:hypothetical protein HPB49_006801 [Dermacentor silvarum]|uniref:Uncharacterized protein n=1 Tax=Dermacentor silvarum TaxID=543639 RepID=A0ACB8DNI4_DERSI|nr:hypothetical protein HPB49_006801 [Dermacentor silvarum]